MNDCRPNDAGVSDEDRAAIHELLAVEPMRNPLHQAQARLTAMRGCRRITQPRIDAFRVAGKNLLECVPLPCAVIAVAQRGDGERIETKRFGGLTAVSKASLSSACAREVYSSAP